MKTSQCVVLLVVGLIVGFCVSGNATGPNANAQGIPIAVPTPRFQVSAWAIGAGPGFLGNHGCYIVDTVSGELWQTTASGKPLKVSDKLP